MQILEIEDGEVVLGVHNDFTKGIINSHLAIIKSAFCQVLNVSNLMLTVNVDPSLQPPDEYTPSISAISVMPQQPSTTPRPAPNPMPRAAQPSLNPKYNFSTFVVGSHNRFVQSAAKAVSENPGQSYNPLFIWGGVGLGKTHIVHAIGQHIVEKRPELLVRYLSCEKFTNELISHIREDRMGEFRKRYRQVDVLLMDDIQFIAGKESTQEEFFHTFNALRDSGKQIVLTSDRPPKAIAHLEDRLRSRFEWGLIADIQVPDYETRLAILQTKAQTENMNVSDPVLEYIASIVTNNIRELEGALIRSNAYANLTGQPLTVSTISSILEPEGPAKPKPSITVDMIIEAVASHYRLETSEIKSSKRSADLALPRHVAIYLAHEVLEMSFPRIGESFGNRKHTTAIYAYRRIKDALSEDRQLAAAVSQIQRQLGL
jgi:chromosomal replication initiator protein